MKYRAFFLTLAALVSIEVLSFFGWRYAELGVVGWALTVAVVGILAVRKPALALGAIFAELVLGGKGYLFHIPLGGQDISLRMGLFAVVVVGWAWHAFRQKNFWGTQKSFWWLWVTWAGVALWAAIIGLLRNNGWSAVFEDANAFLYIALAPAFGLLRSREQFWVMLRTCIAAIIVLALKTALVQGMFSYYPSTQLILLYKWVRDTGVGEITYIIGTLYRVFFQSHVYGLLAFFLGLGLAYQYPQRRWLWTGFAGLGAFVIIVSLSRSFWLGGVASLVVALIGLGISRVSVKFLIRSGISVAAALLIGLVGFQWMLNFPELWGGGGSGGTLVRARSDIQAESAASSRRELLPVITKAIFIHPLTGSGFGAALTYQTKDPRVNTSKAVGGTSYTTTAFELGYHAFAMQYGLPFLVLWIVATGSFLFRTARLLRQDFTDRGLVVGLSLSVVGVCVLHLTTPYLNHPLGIGFFFLLTAALVVTHPRYANR